MRTWLKYFEMSKVANYYEQYDDHFVSMTSKNHLNYLSNYQVFKENPVSQRYLILRKWKLALHHKRVQMYKGEFTCFPFVGKAVGYGLEGRGSIPSSGKKFVSTQPSPNRL
jgi:hypothetical protein